MSPTTWSRRTQKLLKSAVDEVRERRISLRESAKRHRIAKSTLWYHNKHIVTNKRPNFIIDRPCSSAEEEERTIIELLLLYSDTGIPLTRQLLTEAISLFAENISPGRRGEIPFKEGRPGEDLFVFSFVATKLSYVSESRSGKKENVTRHAMQQH